MTREELYNLVWSKPVIHIARDFGISDVAIKKHCKKHDIPTPPVGYWMKLNHGKKVRQSKLPVNKVPADKVIDLTPRDPHLRRYADQLVPALSESERSALEALLSVPTELPQGRPKVVSALRAAFRNTTHDNHGVKQLGDDYRPDIQLSKDGIDRLSKIFCAVSKAAAERGHSLEFRGDKIYWTSGGETFRLQARESLKKTPHEPTAKELKEQAVQDERRKKYPDWYLSDRKVYRQWDYSPSGRLSLTVEFQCGNRWESDPITRRFRDTSKQPVENRLADIILWIEAVTPAATEKREDFEAAQRAEAERQAEIQRRRERRRRAEKLEERMLDMAKIVRTREEVLMLAAHLGSSPIADSWSLQRLVGEVQAYAHELDKQLDLESVEGLLSDAGIDQSTPVLMSALSEIGPEPKYGW